MYRIAVCGYNWSWRISERQRRVGASRRRLRRYNEFRRFFTCWAYLDRYRLFYLSVALGDILGWSTCRPHVFKHFDAVFDKRCCINQRFTHCSSRCSFYSFFPTWFKVPLLMQAPSRPSKTARWWETTAMTSLIAERFGTSCGVVWLQSSPAPGWPSTLMFLVLRSEGRKVGLKDVFGIHFFHSWNIAFHYSSVRCLCPSMC